MVYQLSLEISSFSSHDIFCITICCTKIHWFCLKQIMVKPSQNPNHEVQKNYKNWQPLNTKEKVNVFSEQLMAKRNLVQW